jgi:hemimethylated DNA binding protein
MEQIICLLNVLFLDSLTQLMHTEMLIKLHYWCSLLFVLQKEFSVHILTRISLMLQIEPKQRTENVAYAVGMIMQHRQFNYRCVIYGWDPQCAASQDWIQQMGVENLPNQSHQPFYNVLVEDGSTRYAAQGKINVTVEVVPCLHVECL